MRSNEELFCVIEGTMTTRVVLNGFIPGGFEVQMPGIVEWFRAHGTL